MRWCVRWVEWMMCVCGVKVLVPEDVVCSYVYVLLYRFTCPCEEQLWLHAFE